MKTIQEFLIPLPKADSLSSFLLVSSSGSGLKGLKGCKIVIKILLTLNTVDGEVHSYTREAIVFSILLNFLDQTKFY